MTGQYWLGKHLSQGHKEKIRSSSKQGVESLFWKGEDAGKESKHIHMRKNKPKPRLCEKCKSNPPNDLHNLSGRYKRELDDWIWLCRICHNRHHKLVDMSNRVCEICERKQTSVQKQDIGIRPHWTHYNDKLLCRRCYKRERYKSDHKRGMYKIK